MQKEAFDTEIAHVWGAHRTKMRELFRRARVLSDPVQQRLEQLNSTIAQATGEETRVLWGPARYNLETEELAVPYEISCEKVRKSFRTTITYRSIGAQFDGRSFDHESADRLLVAITQKVWESFQPPQTREVEIYPVR